jgi:putative ABC transport system permease protein
MFLVVAFRIAAAALVRNRMRTGLTTLGITVGIAAVLCTVALGQGSANQVHNDLLNLGESFVWLENGNRNVGGVRTGLGGVPKLTPEDMQAIVRDVPEIVRCSPQVDSRTQVIYGNQNWNTTYRGVTPDYLQIRKWPVIKGASFSELDVEARAKVALLGQAVVDQLFGDDDPLGQSIRVGSHLFTVVGILKAKGTSSSGQNQDDFVLIPYTSVQRYLKGAYTLDDIMCSAASDAQVPLAQQHILDLMRDRHRIQDGQADDFNIQTPDDQIRQREDAAKTMEFMLAGIASVSLLVGGVGIMNIMLVSVAERTREIGLRMAIGAQEADVRLQFLAEAVLLGLLGGAFGILTGWFSARILTESFGWPMAISTNTIVVAVAFASGVGLVFGYFPARHAASLDPIEALRAE